MSPALRERSFLADVAWFSLPSATLPPASTTNLWLLGTNPFFLVDPGCNDSNMSHLLEHWLQDGAGGRESLPTAIVLTHHHGDHVAHAKRLRELLGVPVWAHRATAENLDVPVDRFLSEGDTLSTRGPHGRNQWRVLHTPGHAPGHLCLWDGARRLLVAGDMLAGQGTILIARKDGGVMAEYLQQLRRLIRLAPRVALPGHGDPVQDASGRLSDLLQHRLAREQKVLQALEAVRSPVSWESLLARVYDDTPPRAWPMARYSLQAHLDKLVAEGTVIRDGDTVRLAES